MRKLVCAAVAVAAALAAAMPAAAQEAMELAGSSGGFFRQRPKVAIPAYNMTFVTQQQATAAGSIEARTRLTALLVGPDEAIMRRLADEAHADLVAQLQAAGVEVVANDVAAAMAGNLEMAPGNADVKAVGRGITIGRSIRRGYASYGAAAAPIINAFHNPLATTGAPPPSAFMAANPVGRAARQADSIAVIPELIIDFVQMEAARGDGWARTGGAMQFSVRASSYIVVAGQAAAGPGYAQQLRLREDWVSPTAFANVVQGGAYVNEGTMTPIPDENYQVQDRARGDAIVADMAVWEGLVRDGFRAFNGALVAHIVREKGR